MKTNHDDLKTIVDTFIDCAVDMGRRVPHTASDFGDVQTNFKHLRRIGEKFFWRDMDKHEAFGVFGGEVRGRWIVFVKGWSTGWRIPVLSTCAQSHVRSMLAYDSLEDLKKEWELN